MFSRELLIVTISIRLVNERSKSRKISRKIVHTIIIKQSPLQSIIFELDGIGSPK